MKEEPWEVLYTRAHKHLTSDPVLKPVLERVGPCTLAPGGEPFVVLVRSVVSQLISTAAARTIYGRLESAVSESIVRPDTIKALGEGKLRECGLSLTKARAILDLAERTEDGRLELYNVRTDPSESRNLVAEKKALAELLHHGLKTWRKDVGAQMMTPNPEYVPDPHASAGHFSAAEAEAERIVAATKTDTH